MKDRLAMNEEVLLFYWRVARLFLSIGVGSSHTHPHPLQPSSIYPIPGTLPWYLQFVQQNRNVVVIGGCGADVVSSLWGE